MVNNLENYDQLRQLGAALTAGVQGIDHAYPPNLLDAGTLAHQAWDSLTQATLANCWRLIFFLCCILLSFIKTLEDTISNVLHQLL